MHWCDQPEFQRAAGTFFETFALLRSAFSFAEDNRPGSMSGESYEAHPWRAFEILLFFQKLDMKFLRRSGKC
ncbi:hypothetical protein A6U88_32075 [Agrobacterium sp. B131/95]|nr:hypothetical protein A6U88_32075 [Agrobacterium sp. B131/95]